MLQRYLDLLRSSFEKLTSLGGGNNTWADYFSAVGGEFLVLGVGLLYLVAIFLLFFIPVGGNWLFVKKICKNDIYFRCREIRKYYHSVSSQLRDIVDDIKNEKHKDADMDKLNNKIIDLFASVGITKYKEFSKKSLKSALQECNMSDDVRYDLNYSNGSYWCRAVCECDWTDCGMFSEFGKLTKTSFIKAIAKIACGIIGITTVYLIFAIPLILMLFK